jgi:hypothetical protein
VLVVVGELVLVVVGELVLVVVGDVGDGVGVPASTHTQRSPRQTLARLPEQLPVVVTHPQISPNRHV